MIRQFPHCDARILHAPGECEYCDLHPEWQELRKVWMVAFTGHAPTTLTHGGIQVPCPADFNRPAGSRSDHRHWSGNVATSADYETPASRALYDFELDFEEVPAEPATAGPPPARRATWLRLRRR